MRRAASRSLGYDNLARMNATGKASGGAPQINVHNEGTAKDVDGPKTNVQFDGDKYIIDVFLRDYNNNGRTRQTLRGSKI